MIPGGPKVFAAAIAWSALSFVPAFVAAATPSPEPSSPLIELNVNTDAASPTPAPPPTPTPSPQIEATSEPKAPLPTVSPTPVREPRMFFNGHLVATPKPAATLVPAAAAPVLHRANASSAPSFFEKFAATPSPKPKPTPAPRPTAAPVSAKISVLFGGTWTCSTFGGTKLTHSFAADGSSVIATTTFMLPGGQSAVTHERYTHDAASDTWTAFLAKHTFNVKAGEWNGATWIFTGQSSDGGRLTPVRMIYTFLSKNALRRDFQRRGETGNWETYAGETCGR